MVKHTIKLVTLCHQIPSAGWPGTRKSKRVLQSNYQSHKQDAREQRSGLHVRVGGMTDNNMRCVLRLLTTISGVYVVIPEDSSTSA